MVMGQTPSKSNNKNNKNKNNVWYMYSSTKCVSNGKNGMTCVTMKGNSNSNSKKNTTAKLNKSNTSSFVGLRRYGRRGIISSL